MPPAKKTQRTLTWRERVQRHAQSALPAVVAAGVACAMLATTGYVLFHANFFPVLYQRAIADVQSAPKWPLSLDTKAYNMKMLYLAHYTAPVAKPVATSTASSTVAEVVAPLPFSTATTSVSVPGQLWPKAAAYPQGGALLPFNRIVAYYGNFYSKQMGVLGEYSPDVVMEKLASTTKLWEAADPHTPVIPAIQYIAVVAQGTAGASGLWRAQMPDEEIEKALTMANQMHGLLFLDVQVGKSTLQAELPELAKYLALPNVHLGIDPEFSMKTGKAPGTVIGTFDAKDINYAAAFLANIVRENHLPPKVLVVHRFTQAMVTNTELIKPLPEVQIVMDMDGWGEPARKFNTYKYMIAAQPVQFTGMKLFYHADLRPPSTGMLTPEQVLSLTPAPIYIQYQ